MPSPFISSSGASSFIIRQLDVYRTQKEYFFSLPSPADKIRERFLFDVNLKRTCFVLCTNPHRERMFFFS
jgi:hypothetical protein